jgi:hypothetical protein
VAVLVVATEWGWEGKEKNGYAVHGRSIDRSIEVDWK